MIDAEMLHHGIAIIGMAGRFPRGQGLDAFWKNLRDGVECITFFSDQELLDAGVDQSLLAMTNYVRAHGVLEQADAFDAPFFGYSPREAEILDPQQRIFLECAWEALEGAGYDTQRYEGRIGVYGSTSMSSYLDNLRSRRDTVQSVGGYAILLGNDKDFVATRVAYKLDLKGPSLAVQTGCSSSLVAVHLACQSVLNGECDLALAGGVSIGVPQRSGYLYMEGGIHSPDGHCRAFDAGAQGTVGGSGAGVILLKRLAAALEDGDAIHAVIRGSAVNNDGAMKVGFMAPSVDGQAEVIADALAVAGVGPETISYVEAHGTGTPLGDPVEIAALTQAFRGYTSRRGYCAVGSLKTNIGHLDAAAGIAGLIKTVLALKHREIPPSLHYTRPNAKIDFADSPFYVNATLIPWEAGSGARRAGVSAFGIGGTNAHVVLEEAPVTTHSRGATAHRLLVLSAKTMPALEAMTDALAGHLATHPDVDLAAVAYTLQRGRREFPYRRIVVAQDPAEAATALQRRDPERVSTSRGEASDRQAAFMFSGQGAQYVRMGSGLYRTEPVFRETVDSCAEILGPLLNLDIRHVLFPHPASADEAAHLLSQTYLTQAALFVVEYALAQVWMSWGVHPQAMIGHSVGEYVAACLAGVFSLDDVLMLVAERGRLMQSLPPGAMLAVHLPEHKLRALQTKDIALAAVNAPALCTVAGPGEAIGDFQDLLARRGVECRRLHTSHAFHSPMMEPIVDALADRVARVSLHPPRIPFLSNVSGTWIEAAQAMEPAYWGRHLRQTVRFADGVCELLREPSRVLLEVGPGHTLTTLALQQTGGVPRALPSLPRPHEQMLDVVTIVSTLGRLWLEGIHVDWAAFTAQERGCRLALPTYPFERRRYWVEAAYAGGAGGQSTGGLSAAEDRVDQPVDAVAAAEGPTDPRDSHIAPRTEIEKTIAIFWQELLGIDQVSIHDDFFVLGGHSLMAAQLLSRLRSVFAVDLPLLSIFEHPTVERLANAIEALMMESLADLTDEEAQRLASTMSH
jgi:acyl transferase domain-containing protein